MTNESNSILQQIITNPPSAVELRGLTPEVPLNTLHGQLPFRMTNDALFHIVFSTNKIALKGLLCSLLHKHPDDIVSIDIRSPLVFGPELLSKKFIMDLKVLLNDNTIINIEMQVASFAYWRERSLTYLCKSFGDLNEGDSYEKARQTIHIGILDFKLFKKEPVFYDTFHLASDITHEIYSDKLRLSVLQLGYRELATPDDKFWHLDEWAAFFKATSWEEVIALANQNPAIAEAAKTMQTIMDDSRIQYIYEARLAGERTWLSYEQDIQKAKQKLADAQTELAEKQTELAETQAALVETQSNLVDAQTEIAHLKSLLNK